MPKQIAPRLFSGEKRIANGTSLPPHIKRGLQLIARDENQSVSWVMEQVVIKYFKLKEPKYVERKTNAQLKKRRR